MLSKVYTSSDSVMHTWQTFWFLTCIHVCYIECQLLLTNTIINTHVRKGAYIHTFANICMHTYTHTFIYTRTHTYTHLHSNSHECAYTNTYYTHSYIFNILSRPTTYLF